MALHYQVQFYSLIHGTWSANYGSIYTSKARAQVACKLEAAKHKGIRHRVVPLS